MEINIENIKTLINERFRGNQTWFSEEMGVDRAYMSRLLNNKVPLNSPKVCHGLIKYCKENKLNIKNYINI